MISFSNGGQIADLHALKLDRGLDAMVVVYSLLDNHPASTVCEQFIRARTGWFTTTLTLFEIKAILTKVYGVDPILATQKIEMFSTGAIAVASVDLAVTSAAMQLADAQGIDMTDAVLLHTAQTIGAKALATDDRKLIQVCQLIGITPENPINRNLRRQIAAWETNNLPLKGLPRILGHIYRWLNRKHPQTAQDFWSQTGGGSHLP